MRTQYDAMVKSKDREIADQKALVEQYKDFKVRLSTKMIGETLEQHCSYEFNKNRMGMFPHAYFEKDNDARTGSKGDFIFRDFDYEGTEIISIMFEMKNENETTSTKHKNEDFLKELDKDRREKKCEYAVLWYCGCIISLPKDVCHSSAVLYSNHNVIKKCGNECIRLQEAIACRKE